MHQQEYKASLVSSAGRPLDSAKRLLFRVKKRQVHGRFVAGEKHYRCPSRGRKNLLGSRCEIVSRRSTGWTAAVCGMASYFGERNGCLRFFKNMYVFSPIIFLGSASHRQYPGFFRSFNDSACLHHSRFSFAYHSPLTRPFRGVISIGSS